LDAFLYAPDPEQVRGLLTAHAAEHSLDYAVTGAAAATALGAHVTTAIPRVMVRIDPNVPPLKAADLLQAEPVDGGGNLLLVRDVGRLGLEGGGRIGPLHIASPVRIWLDMLGEARGEDAAALFREAVIGW
jgi:hypothetical protein